MEQMRLFGPPYKYIIDASSILSQKENEAHRRRVYRSQWERIDKYIEEKVIVTCSEIADEIQDDAIKGWLRKQACVILPIDDEIQQYVKKIVNEHPKMLDFSDCKSSGDAFLIATAMKYELTVITEENPKKKNRIPQICASYGIKSLNITELCDVENWEF